MDDIRKPNNTKLVKPKKPEKTLTIKVNRKLFIAIVAIVVLVGVFFLGSAYGSHKQKKQSTNSLSNVSRSAFSNRWTAVGTIIEASESEVKIKDSRDQIKTASINKDTKIVDRKGTEVPAEDLKKDQRIIASGEKDGDNLTVTRVRLQQ